jgi:hypothetical protein
VRMLDDLATLSPEDLAELVQGMTPRERAGLMRLMEDEALSPYIKYGGDIRGMGRRDVVRPRAHH